MDKQIKSQIGVLFLGQVRTICMSFPEVEEKVDSFGHTSFRVKDKPFVMMGENETENGTSLAIKTLKTTQEILLQRKGFFKTPYIGQHGWTSLFPTEETDWEEIKDFILEGYFRTAPKSLVKLLK